MKNLFKTLCICFLLSGVFSVKAQKTNNKTHRYNIVSFLSENGVSKEQIPEVKKRIGRDIMLSRKSGKPFVMDSELKSYLANNAGLKTSAISELDALIVKRMQAKHNRGKSKALNGFLLKNGVSKEQISEVKKRIGRDIMLSRKSGKPFVMDSELKSYLTNNAGLKTSAISELDALIVKRMQAKHNRGKSKALNGFLLKNGVSKEQIPEVKKRIGRDIMLSRKSGKPFVMDSELKSYLTNNAGLKTSAISELDALIVKRMQAKHNRGKSKALNGFLLKNGVSKEQIPEVKKRIGRDIMLSRKSGKPFVMDSELKSYLTNNAGLKTSAVSELNVLIVRRVEGRSERRK